MGHKLKICFFCTTMLFSVTSFAQTVIMTLQNISSTEIEPYSITGVIFGVSNGIEEHALTLQLNPNSALTIPVTFIGPFEKNARLIWAIQNSRGDMICTFKTSDQDFQNKTRFENDGKNLVNLTINITQQGNQNAECEPVNPDWH